MNVLSILERQTLPFHFSVEQNGTEQNGKNAFTLAPRTVVERLERFSLCSVNTVYIYTDTYPITLPCSLARVGNKLTHYRKGKQSLQVCDYTE